VIDLLGGGEHDQTPLDPDEADGLIPSWITTQGDLDRAEQENVAKAQLWAVRLRLTPAATLDEAFLRRLHKRMFSDVWRWAGTYRRSNKNIGVDHWQIIQEIGQLLGNANYWLENDTFSYDELVARFHHRLVWIHPFANGNGRASRLAADLLAESVGEVRFSWGASLATNPAELRRAYIDALRAADAGDVAPLLDFVRL
jgi:Fic-DOC domain mobile mystery protein B